MFQLFIYLRQNHFFFDLWYFTFALILTLQITSRYVWTKLHRTSIIILKCLIKQQQKKSTSNFKRFQRHKDVLVVNDPDNQCDLWSSTFHKRNLICYGYRLLGKTNCFYNKVERIDKSKKRTNCNKEIILSSIVYIFNDLRLLLHPNRCLYKFFCKIFTTIQKR